MKRVRLALVLALICLLLCACGQEILPVSEMEASAAPEGTFWAAFLDVGQADATLVCCDGEYMLIDGGNVDDGPYVVESLMARDVQSRGYFLN